MLRNRIVAVVVALIAVLGTTAVVSRPVAGAAGPAGSVGVDADQAGTSWYSDQTALTPQLVTGGSFGQLFASQLDGDIQAQPLVEDGVLLAETEEDMAYGLNPATGSITWTKSLGTPFSSASIGCTDLPSVGVTGTPVVDTATNIEYFLSKVYASGTSGPAQYWMHALSVTTGAEQPNFPVQITGTASDDPTQAFNPTYQLQRPGLLLMNGVVYAGFGSHCDLVPTHGWVIGVSTAGKVTTLWSDEAGIATNGEGGIWAPGALRSDGPGQIILSTGNGYDPTAPSPGNADPEPTHLAQAVIRLTVQPDGSLKTTDFFIPLDAKALNQIDGDLGAGSPVILPASFSTPAYPRLAIEIGKEGYLYVMDASQLGGYEQGPSGGDDVLARLGPVQGVWGSPAVWGGDGGYLYFITNGGSATGAPGATDGKLLAWKFGVDGTGKPTFSLVGSSSDAFGYSSSSPVVTSSGTTSGTSILWANWADGPGSTLAQLRAYNPIPDAEGKLDLLWSAPSGASVKLSEPGVADNRIYQGGFDGVIRGYGAPVQSPLAGGSVGFANTTVGHGTTVQDVFTANEAETVTAITSTGSAFSLGTPSSPVPITMSANQTFSVPVTFTPTEYGIVGGVVTVTTSAGKYQVGLSGTGLSAGAQLTVAPSAVSFEGTPIDSTVTEDAVFTNQGSQSLNITGETLPAAPFTVGGLPPDGTTLVPGASVSVSISFSPTAAGSFLDEFTLASDTGGSADVDISGTAGAPPKLVVTPTALNYGIVPVGQALTKTFTVTNSGGTPLTVTKSKPPGEGEFASSTALPEGTTIQAGQSMTESVTFTPTAAGTFTDSWPLNGTGNSVLTTVTFTGVGGSLGPVPLANWTLHGDATLSGSAVDLVPAALSQAGSAVAPSSVPTDGLSVGFDATIGGGTGANGMTLTFAAPTSKTFLGQGGGSLGYSGVSGVAVGLSDFKQGADPSANFVGIADGGPVSGIPNWVATDSTIPALRGATTHVTVSVAGHQLTVTVGGVQVLQKTVADLPSVADLDFTAATGGRTDSFVVQNVTVQSSLPLPPDFGNWALKGTATQTGSGLTLTTASPGSQAGSATSPVLVATDGLTVSFDAVIGGGSGANGMTLTFASPSSPTFLGQGGGSLGYSGISGVGVGLVNFKQGADPSANFVGIADGGPVSGIPDWVATNSSIPTLQAATTHVTASINGTRLTVWVGGVQVLSEQVADIPADANLVFTAATGGRTDSFQVQNVSITHSVVDDPAAWTTFGTAKGSASAIALTSASPTFQTGSAVSPVSVATSGLVVSFDAVIGGGSGANGMTLTFASPTSATLLGQSGGSLGYSGISGVGVGLVNFKQGADPSANFVGIADGGPVSGIPKWMATNSTIPTLQGAITHVSIAVVGTKITVTVAGAQVLQTTVADLLPVADLVFTAATGGLTDNFGVQNLAVS
jgi:hypothetical protein